MNRPVFVFGSNLAGIHGAGSARHAVRHHGAVYGVGIGRQGNSYAIPTKDRYLRVLPLTEIKKHVEEFLQYASRLPEDRFEVVAIGTGLAGYQHSQIAPLFKNAPANCTLPQEWVDLLAQDT